MKIKRCSPIGKAAEKPQGGGRESVERRRGKGKDAHAHAHAHEGCMALCEKAKKDCKKRQRKKEEQSAHITFEGKEGSTTVTRNGEVARRRNSRHMKLAREA